MKTQFAMYYAPSETELKAIWQGALIVLDANVLLNLYRYSPSTRDELFDLLDSLKTQLWLPNQAALEFHRNRPNVILAEGRTYSDAKEQAAILLKRFDEDRSHPFLSKKLASEVRRTLGALEEEMTEGHASHRGSVTRDAILDRITTLFDGRVGTPYTEDALVAKEKEAKKRYERDTPPGYKDRDSKDDARKYGDAILWFQILDRAKSAKQNVILVTDDRKSDWWWQATGGEPTLGPRPELRKEFHDVTEQRFFMYKPHRFMKYAKEHLERSVNEEAIQEAKKRESTQRTIINVSREKLVDNLEGLTRVEKLVLILYYSEEMTMREIAETLDLSESRVSQIHKEVLQRLRSSAEEDNS